MLKTRVVFAGAIRNNTAARSDPRIADEKHTVAQLYNNPEVLNQKIKRTESLFTALCAGRLVDVVQGLEGDLLSCCLFLHGISRL